VLGGAITSPILVTGSTGTFGRYVVRRLGDAGYKVRALSRHSHKSGDSIQSMTGALTTGEGIRRDGRVGEPRVERGGDPKIGMTKAPQGP
jgi:nucleoside-diphosphate-sugar epimerase